jgi:hypothetical protein
MESQIKQWMITQITARQHKTDYSKLPALFEYDAVKYLYSIIKPHFDKRDIKRRITASKATTFEDLLHALD